MERGSSPPGRPDPERPPGPETPPGPQAPPPAPQAPPGYGGPVPPGGWQQPIARPESGWAGKPLASWGSRLGATLIDWLILLIPAAIVGALIIGSAFDDDSSAWAVVGTSILSFILWAALILFYAPLLMMREGGRNGQTLGKQLVGIRVVRDNGESMGFGWAALREVLVKNIAVGIASSILFFIPWFLNYFWPLWDDQNRALHDMVVSTHVIRA
jgi:uncharacterized RDD family membrane protein YckC